MLEYYMNFIQIRGARTIGLHLMTPQRGTRIWSTNEACAGTILSHLEENTLKTIHSHPPPELLNLQPFSITCG